MNNILKVFTFVFALVISQVSFASETYFVSQGDRTVYYLPKIKLSVTLYDLDGEGGVILVSADYDSKVLKNQMDSLAVEFTDFKLKRMTARIPNEVLIRVQGLDTVVRASVHNNPLGPYFNAEFDLSRRQMKSLKSQLQSNSIESLIEIDAGIESEYNNILILEKFSLDAKVCSQLTSKSFGDLIWEIHAMKKPETITLQSTYSSFKQDLLQSCFQINEQDKPVHSLNSLLRREIYVSPTKSEIIGQTVESHFTPVRVVLEDLVVRKGE